jgi:serine acetyltransferase
VRSNAGKDILRYLTKSAGDRARGDSFRTRLSAALSPEVFPVILHRVAHYFWTNERYRMAEILTRANCYLHKVNISADSCIGPGLRLPHPAGVTFRGNAGSGVTIYSLAVCCEETNTERAGKRGPELGDGVTIGAHAVVLGEVKVGSGASVFYSIALERDAPETAVVSSRALRYTFKNRCETKSEA